MRPFLLILTGGVLLILFTVRSLIEDSKKGNEDINHKILIWEVIRILVSEIFCILSGNFICFMVFAVYSRWIIMPFVMYTLTKLVVRDTSPAIGIVEGLILVGISIVVYCLEELSHRLKLLQKQAEDAVTSAAVNELYERQLNRELVRQNYLADRNARLEERENISRNIHNSVGHTITAAVMALDAADMLFEVRPQDARQKMQTANIRMREGIQSIRHAVRVLDDERTSISMEDFLSELNDIIENFIMDTDIKVKKDFTDINNKIELPREHTEFLTGALKELLTNGVRHGNADVFLVRLITDSGHIRLQVQDNGSSDFNDANESIKIEHGFGLKKLISYGERTGGRVSFNHENGLMVDITLMV